MGKRFNGKQELQKRNHKFRGGRGRPASKKARTDEQVVRSLSPSSEEESSEDQIPEQVVYKEPSMYDDLLTKLGSSNKSLADVYKRRQRREEGNSDTEEDGAESIGESEEEDGNDAHIMSAEAEQVEDAEGEDESEGSGTDQEHHSDVNDLTAIKSLACTSSFSVHLEHKLTEVEVENLSKKKWKYEWEVPAANMSNCRWMGTGEQFPKQLGHETAMTAGGTLAEKAQNLLRSRLCDRNFIFKPLSDSPDSNYSKLKYVVSSSVTEACNNSVLLLGPRGSGKIAVLELVLGDLLQEHPDMISMIKLNGLLHSDDNCAIKEIARQLCIEHHLMFSRMASFDDNSQFMIAMLRECGLAHKTIIFVLDEFDLFTQGKQRLLYSLLDAMQSVTSQAVVIGVSCRLDADQLLEKRVRSRFSHRKLLFLPLSMEDLQRLLEHVLSLPLDSSLPHDYAVEFNSKLQDILADHRFKEMLSSYLDSDSTVNHLLRFLFCAISNMDLGSGFLSLENFKTAASGIQRQPKLECLKDCSILELYILVCMKRLEVKEQTSYNFQSVMKEYKTVHDSFQTSDYYAQNVCLRAFERLLQCELICFTDNRGQSQSVEFRQVKLLISSRELYEGLKSYRSCPIILRKLMDN